MLLDAAWALSLLGLSVGGYGWMSSRFAVSTTGTLLASLLGLFSTSMRGSRTLQVSEIAIGAATGYFAPQWSISSYLEILYYIRPILIILESLVFTAAIDRTSLALKANIDQTWAKVVTLGVSLFSLILGTFLLYEAFSTDPIPTLAAALLGALVCAHIGTLVGFMSTNRGMILNWAVHYLLTNWQAAQALADWRVYTAQGTFYERSLTALTASLVTTVAVFLLPFVIFWSPDQQVFGTESVMEKWGKKTRGSTEGGGFLASLMRRPKLWWVPALLQVLYAFSILSATGEIRSDGGTWRSIQCLLSIGLYVLYLCRDESSREV